jgi:hypothetical protein
MPLFHFYSRAKNYSKAPQNGIEIIPFGDPARGTKVRLAGTGVRV